MKLMTFWRGDRRARHLSLHQIVVDESLISSLCTHKSGSYMVTRTCATAQTSPPAEHIPLVAYDTQTDAHKMRREYTLVNGAVSLLSSSSLSSFHHHRLIPPPPSKPKDSWSFTCVCLSAPSRHAASPHREFTCNCRVPASVLFLLLLLLSCCLRD